MQKIVECGVRNAQQIGVEFAMIENTVEKRPDFSLGGKAVAQQTESPYRHEPGHPFAAGLFREFPVN